MILESEGKTKAAQKVRDAALNFRIGPSGRTIARSLAALDPAPREGAEES